jgi:hypothetical protein
MSFQSWVDFIKFRRMFFDRNPGLRVVLLLTVLLSLPTVLYCTLGRYSNSPRAGSLLVISPFTLLLLLRVLVEYNVIRLREAKGTPYQ